MSDCRSYALLITSNEVEDASFFRYEAEIEPASGRTIAARSSQLWEGKRKDKSSPIVGEGTVDVASAIHLLRRTLPEAPKELEIWSDGKLYPVLVQPLGPAIGCGGHGAAPARPADDFDGEVEDRHDGNPSTP